MSTEYANLGFRVDSSGLMTADQRLKNVTQSGKKTDAQMIGLSKSVGLVSAAFVALGGVISTRELIKYSDSWNNLNSQLKQVTNSEKELIAVRSQLLDVSRVTSTDLESTVGLYTVLDRATSKLGVTTQEQIDITKTMNNMFLASGKSASETAGAIRQLSQGLESGALRGDEFNSVSEGAPRILDAISNSTGIARGELRAFAATGGITAEILVNALKDYQDEAQKAADLTGMTFSQAMQIANTNMTEFAGKSRALASTVDYLSGSVVSVSEILVDNVQYVEAYFDRFGAYADDIEEASNTISGSFAEIVNSSAEAFPALADNSETLFGQIIQGFKDLPDNIRALIKIMTVELAYLVDVGLAYGKSFAEVLGVQFGVLIDKSAIWGKQLWNNLNPFDDAIDFEGDVARIEKIASEMTASIIDSAVARADIVRKARLSSIDSILQERDASISAYKKIKDSIDSTGESVIDLTQRQSDLFAGFREDAEAPKWISGTKTDLDSLIDQVDNFGGAWTRTGNIIADSMGDAVRLLDDFASKMQSIEKLQADLTNERYKYNDGTKEAIQIDESLARLQQESAKAQIGAIGQTIGLSSQLFKENSKERKALHALEMGFMAVEIALAAEKAVVNAVSAVANQGQGDPYTAFGRIAAMIGVMGGVLAAAGIGFSAGGGGGNYSAPTGGAGTVLGDSSAQSSSISNASERLEDIQTDQLSELMAIRQSMSQLSSGIQNLAKSFATDLDFNSASGELENSNFLDTKLGGILRKIDPIARAADWIDKLTGGLLGLGGVVDKIFGGFSSKKQKLIDSGITFVSQTMQDVFESGNLDASMFQVIETTKKKFWGLSKKKSTSTETTSISGAITSQMADIFGYIGDTVVAAANSLGMDAKHIITTGLESLSLDEALANFVIDIGDVSFADKTGEEIQKELEAIFSQQADLMAQYLVPSITEYQQVGEGAFETLQRVAYEQAIFNDALDRTGVSLKDLSNIMQIDIAQSIISLVGGVEEFSELANSFFDNFYSEAEQFNYLQSSISDVFSELGIGMVASRDEFRNLVEGIDLTTESGQQLYASLMQVNPAMAEYFNALDDLARDKLGLQIELLKAQGKSEEALAIQRQMELDALDESLHSLQLQVWAQQDLNKAREEERQLLTDNVAFAEQQLEKARQAEIARINSTVEAAEEAYNSTLESINLQREAYNKMISELQSAVDTAASNLQASLNAELSKYDDLISASRERANEEISLINSISSARVSALSSELSLISGIASQYGASSFGVSASEALRAARAGNFEPATRVQTGGNFSNATEARISKAREDFALAEIGKLADAQMSDLERTISATESSAQSQIDAINAASEREVAQLESQRAAVEEQVKEILGITDTVLSLDEATAQYQKAQDDLQNALAENTLDKLQAQENIALQSLEQAREDAQKQIDALNEQVDSLLNIDNSVSSVDEAIKLLLAERKELAEFEKNIQESQLSSQQETTSAVLLVESAIKQSMIGIKDSIDNSKVIDNRPPDQNAPIIVYAPSSGDDKMLEEIKMLRKDLDNANAQIGENTARTASSIRNLEYMQSVK